MSVELLTLGEAAERVRLSTWTVRRAIMRGELEAFKPAGRLRIPGAAVDAWLASARIEPETVRPLARPTPSSRVPRRSGRFRACLEDEHARR